MDRSRRRIRPRMAVSAGRPSQAVFWYIRANIWHGFTMSAHPRGFVPQRFKRPLLVTSQPPHAELPLQQRQRQSYRQRETGAGVLIQAQAVAIIYRRADDGLHHITGQTHAAQRREYLQPISGI